MTTDHIPNPLASKLERIKVLKSDYVHNGKIYKEDDEILVPWQVAEDAVFQRLASFVHAVEILQEGIVNNLVVHSPGDITTFSEDRACFLHEHGAARILDPAKLSRPLPAVKPKWQPEEETPKSIHDPVECRVLRPLFHGKANLEPGAKITVSRAVAEYFASVGAVEPVGWELPRPFKQAAPEKKFRRASEGESK